MAVVISSCIEWLLYLFLFVSFIARSFFAICRRIKIKRKSQFCLYLLNKKEEDIINITLLALLRVGGELKSSPRTSLALHGQLCNFIAILICTSD